MANGRDAKYNPQQTLLNAVKKYDRRLYDFLTTTDNFLVKVSQSDINVPISGAATSGVIGCVTDAAAAVITTGSKGFIRIPFDCTLTGWTILADQVGSIQYNIKKCIYSSFPTTINIVGATAPTLTAQQNNTSNNLAGWDTTINAGDVLEFLVVSAATISRAILELQITK